MKRILPQLLKLSVLCLLTVVVATPSLAITRADKRIMDLKNPDAEVRAKAAYDLGCGCMRAMRAVPALTNLLHDPVAKVRRNAATALGAFHTSSAQIIPVLLERLSDDDVEVRRAAIIALGMLGNGSQPAQHAVVGYMSDPDPMTKTAAIVAAATMGKRDDSMLSTLIKALGSNQEDVAKAARKAVTDMGNEEPGKIIPSLLAVLNENGDPAVVHAVRILGALRQHAAPTAPQLAAVYDKVKPVDRHYVVDALLAVDTSGEQAIAVLNKSLRALDPVDRREALLGLMRYRTNVSAILPSVTMAFHDASESNRLLAVSIVRSLGEKAQAALPALLPLTRLPDVRMRKAAVGAIGSIRPKSPEAVAALEKTIADKNLSVKLVSVYALRRIADVSSDQVKNDIGKILLASYKLETDSRMKEALNSAILARTGPAVHKQHTKLDPPGKQAKPKGDPSTSQKVSP